MVAHLIDILPVPQCRPDVVADLPHAEPITVKGETGRGWIVPGVEARASPSLKEMADGMFEKGDQRFDAHRAQRFWSCEGIERAGLDVECGGVTQGYGSAMHLMSTLVKAEGRDALGFGGVKILW